MTKLDKAGLIIMSQGFGIFFGAQMQAGRTPREDVIYIAAFSIITGILIPFFSLMKDWWRQTE